MNWGPEQGRYFLPRYEEALIYTAEKGDERKIEEGRSE